MRVHAIIPTVVLLSSIETAWGSDQLMLSLQSPAGVCRSSAKCLKSLEKIERDFVIQSFRFIHPTKECKGYINFNSENIASFREQLSEAWPSLGAESNLKNWENEWNKHGGDCILHIAELVGVKEFFGTSLKLFSDLNITQSLKEADILPSTKRPYLTKDVHRAIKKRLPAGVDVNLVCVKGEKFPNHILKEVRICVDEKVKFVTCQPSAEQCEAPEVLFLPLRGEGRELPILPKSSAWTTSSTSTVAILIAALVQRIAHH